MGRPYAEVIGDPVAHSKSPDIHAFWIEKLGLRYDFRRTRVRREDFGAFLEDRRQDPDWCGCSVTIPHKQAATASLDEMCPAAAEIGAVNCITRRGDAQIRLIGENTDWTGFLEPLRPWLAQQHEFRLAYIIGTGGAASAVSYALKRSGFTIVTLARDLRKGLALRRRLDLRDDHLLLDMSALQGPDCDPGDRTGTLDLLVNATPLGMAAFPPLEIDLAGWIRGGLVYDLVYHPLETPLLRQARELGLEAIDGLGMLIGQAATAFESFFCTPAPREHDSELRELLTR